MSDIQKKSLHLSRHAKHSMTYIVREASWLRSVRKSGKFSNVSRMSVDAHSPLCRFEVGDCPYYIRQPSHINIHKVRAVPHFLAYGYLPEPSDGKC